MKTTIHQSAALAAVTVLFLSLLLAVPWVVSGAPVVLQNEPANHTETPHPTNTAHPTATTHPTETPHHTPTPYHTPHPTSTPHPTDTTPPTGTLTINDGAESTDQATVTLNFSATDDVGVEYVYVREWGWDHEEGWHDAHHGDHDGHCDDHHGEHDQCHRWSQWEPYVPSMTLVLSPKPGIKYVTAWFADAAWNVSGPATDQINLLAPEQTISQTHVHQYRHWLQAGQRLTVTVHAHSGDPDLYVWEADGDYGPPEHHSNETVGDDSLSYQAGHDGWHLIEVHGYTTATYTCDIAVGPPAREASRATTLASKPLPTAPLVSTEPNGQEIAPTPFRIYLPLVRR